MSTTASPESIDWNAAGEEATRHLQALLRLDTTNPPGNETLAANYLAGALRAEGIEVEIVEATPGRGNLIARLRAANPVARPLMLMGHTDVVSVEREAWSRDPFGGELANGEIWGRGALDMKSQVAAELTVLLLLQRQGVSLDRDLIFAAFADEEAGGQDGAAWIWEHRRELIDAEYAINEGGGWPITLGGERFYLCQAGEKGASRLRITARGVPGHASVPLDDTAMHRLGLALTRLHAWEPPTVLTSPVRLLLESVADALGGQTGTAVAAILANPTWEAMAALPLDDDTRRMLRATTRNTAVPTIVHGGHRINVIPSEVILDVDGRILPDEDPHAWRDLVQSVVGDEVEVTLLSEETGIAADPASPLYEAIVATMAELAPGTRVAPYLVSGGTDARHLPGVKVYGFFTTTPGAPVALYSSLIHGHDERIGVADLAMGTRFLYELVARFCGSGDGGAT
ncbi:MAG: M20/M25/M40 family metallo-hydrolase [Chloroflexota bacterium]|nr:M20/M25/M40 family metallo-hydrolase [Chloroflexota bacterium]